MQIYKPVPMETIFALFMVIMVVTVFEQCITIKLTKFNDLTSKYMLLW